MLLPYILLPLPSKSKVGKHFQIVRAISLTIATIVAHAPKHSSSPPHTDAKRPSLYPV